MKKKVLICILVLLFIFEIILNISILFFPKIKLEGDSYIKVPVFEERTFDSVSIYRFGKKIKAKIQEKNNVDFKKIGKYEIEYIYKYGMITMKKNRTIEIVDEKEPTITLKGDKEKTICPNAIYEEEGYEAKDNYDGDLTDKVIVTSTEDNITYTVTDSSKNKTEVTRTIKKEDKEKPVIKLKGNATVYMNVNTPYKEEGYIVEDNCSKDLTEKVTIKGVVNTFKVGSYKKTYTVRDESGNEASVTRTIIVRNPTKSSTCTGKAGVIYLTFDDGPNAVYTPIILDVLKKYNVKATFFVTMAGPDSLIKREHEEGHTVALHTASHNYKTVYSSIEGYFDDLIKVQNRVYNITGIRPTLIRFPGGSSNTVSRNYAKGIMSILANEVEDRGFIYHDWNISSGDAGGTTDPRTEYNNVVSRLSKNCSNVILMHDIKKHTSLAIEDIIKYGLENGYTFEAMTPETAPVHQTINN